MSVSPILSFRIKDAEYKIRVGDFTPEEAGLFRRTVGLPLMHSFGVVDLDIIAAFVWLVRRRAEHDLTYAAVASSFTYDDYEGHTDEAATEDDPIDPPA